jgi:rare lipoprotein A
MLGRRLKAAGMVALVAAGSPAFAGGKPQSFSGVAAYYDANYHGRTAAGVPYDPHKFTAAHRTLPFGTRLKVTDRRTGRSVEVTVNDRGPFTRGRVLDLSLAAAKQLRMLDRGLVRVTADVESATSSH